MPKNIDPIYLFCISIPMLHGPSYKVQGNMKIKSSFCTQNILPIGRPHQSDQCYTLNTNCMACIRVTVAPAKQIVCPAPGHSIVVTSAAAMIPMGATFVIFPRVALLNGFAFSFKGHIGLFSRECFWNFFFKIEVRVVSQLIHLQIRI